MSATPRELVYQTLRREAPARAPRQIWLLPWAEWRYPDELAAIRRDYPEDIQHVAGHFPRPVRTPGDAYQIGSYVDEWGCTFQNIQAGVIGEVKAPLIADWESDAARVRFPDEVLDINRDATNRDCASTDRFTIAGGSPNPFERMQFLRGSEALYMDLADPPAAMLRFLTALHRFYCRQLDAWARSDVDALMMGDDWGSQRGLLIRPALWREVFKPMYRDYVQIAHSAGKQLFMHSDGHILDIYPDLIEIGVDAVNSQVFCMGIENLRPFAGKITFWGEMDRQHLMPHGSGDDIANAVISVCANLWRDGGCIAQCEFGAATRPENVRQVFATWDAVTAEGK
jgi:uroporphyrinogen decarboxylase